MDKQEKIQLTAIVDFPTSGDFPCFIDLTYFERGWKDSIERSARWFGDTLVSYLRSNRSLYKDYNGDPVDYINSLGFFMSVSNCMDSAVHRGFMGFRVILDFDHAVSQFKLILEAHTLTGEIQELRYLEEYV